MRSPAADLVEDLDAAAGLGRVVDRRLPRKPRARRISDDSPSPARGAASVMTASGVTGEGRRTAGDA
jgi:hypothetical protein